MNNFNVPNNLRSIETCHGVNGLRQETGGGAEYQPTLYPKPYPQPNLTLKSVLLNQAGNILSSGPLFPRPTSGK